MKRFLFVGGLMLPLLGTSLVEAADLQINRAPTFAPPPGFSWTGFYLGGNVGAGIGTTETSVGVGPALSALSGMPITATAPLVSETSNGFVSGIQAGYNWQTGVFVFGVEGDLDAAGLQGTAPCAVVLNCTIKHNWFADITGRVGVVAVERTLIYIKGGVAWEGSDFTVATASILLEQPSQPMRVAAGFRLAAYWVWGWSTCFCRTGRRSSNITTSISGPARSTPRSGQTPRLAARDWPHLPEQRCRLQSPKTNTLSRRG